MSVIVWAVLATLSVPSFAQPADPETNPEAYWNRGWNCGQSAANFNVAIQAEDAEAAFLKVDAAMVAMGAASQAGSNGMSIRYSGGEQIQARHLQYSLPVKAGEKAAKKVWDYGELVSYSVNHVKPEELAVGIKERISRLEKELEDDALARLPSARYFLKSKLSSMRQVLAQCERGVDRASLTVSIQPKPAGSRR